MLLDVGSVYRFCMASMAALLLQKSSADAELSCGL
jgi:hypothetical protein